MWILNSPFFCGKGIKLQTCFFSLSPWMTFFYNAEFDPFLAFSGIPVSSLQPLIFRFHPIFVRCAALGDCLSPTCDALEANLSPKLPNFQNKIGDFPRNQGEIWTFVPRIDKIGRISSPCLPFSRSYFLSFGTIARGKGSVIGIEIGPRFQGK